MLLPVCSQNCMVSIDTHLPRKVHFKGNSCSSKRQQIAVKWRINAFSRLGQSSCKASEEPGPRLHGKNPKLKKGGGSRLFIRFLKQNTHTHTTFTLSSKSNMLFLIHFCGFFFFIFFFRRLKMRHYLLFLRSHRKYQWSSVSSEHPCKIIGIQALER